jgi:hypothetical protein
VDKALGGGENKRREEQKKNERIDLEPHLEIFDTGKYKG